MNSFTSSTSTQSCMLEEVEEAHAQKPATGICALHKFGEENRTDVDLNEEVSVDPNSASRDPPVTMHTPRTGTDQCRVGHRPLQSLTEWIGLKRNRKNIEVVRLSTLKSVPSVGFILSVTPPSCGGPMTRSSASSFVDVVWRMS